MQGQILGAWCKAHYLKGTVHGPALAYLAASRLIVGVESWSPCDAPAPGMQTTWGCVVVLRACVLVGWRSLYSVHRPSLVIVARDRGT